MKYFIGALILLLLGGGYYFFFSQPTLSDDDTVEQVVEEEVTEEVLDLPVENRYTSKEWGISFEYPAGWEIKEPAFGSVVSFLNLSIDPKNEKKYPNTVLINITPKSWIENALVKLEARGIIPTLSSVADYDALLIQDEVMGIPSNGYLILVNDSYWIDISVKQGYEDQLQQILDTLQITPVDISGREPGVSL